MTVERSGLRLPAYTEAELVAIEHAIIGWGEAIRLSIPVCGAPGMSCGGVCGRPVGHEPPCYCDGVDEDGEETCPA